MKWLEIKFPFPPVCTISFHYYLHKELLDFKKQDLKISGARITVLATLKSWCFWRIVFLTHLHVSTYLHHTEEECYPWHEWHSLTTTTVITIFCFHHLPHVPPICFSENQANVPESVSLNIILSTLSFPALAWNCNKYQSLGKLQTSNLKIKLIGTFS